VNTTAPNSSFLTDEDVYQRWRRGKLDAYPKRVTEILVPIDGLRTLTDAQNASIKRSIKRANMVIYRCRDMFVDRAAVVSFARRFGLTRIDHHLCANADGVSELSVAATGVRSDYVPYSNRSLSWHTDGYYNDKQRQINAVILHCAQSAVSGGENALFDPDIAYIRLRDEDPRFITAFEHPECMTIPANTGAEGEIRPALTGPVFSYGAQGEIHMRYSARRKNIRWRDDPLTRAARDFLTGILNETDGMIFHYRLQKGEGLLSNNVLHDRTSFSDGQGQQRLLYRARFFDRIEIQNTYNGAKPATGQ
jgi:alpha-ketoglutarate-dependent taurine dioxygenase